VSSLRSSIHCTDRTFRPLKVEALTQPHRPLRTPCSSRCRPEVQRCVCVCWQVSKKSKLHNFKLCSIWKFVLIHRKMRLVLKNCQRSEFAHLWLKLNIYFWFLSETSDVKQTKILTTCKIWCISVKDSRRNLSETHLIKNEAGICTSLKFHFYFSFRWSPRTKLMLLNFYFIYILCRRVDKNGATFRICAIFASSLFRKQ